MKKHSGHVCVLHSFHSLVDYWTDDENVVDDHDDGTIDDDPKMKEGMEKNEEKKRFSDARLLVSN